MCAFMAIHPSKMNLNRCSYQDNAFISNFDHSKKIRVSSSFCPCEPNSNSKQKNWTCELIKHKKGSQSYLFIIRSEHTSWPHTAICIKMTELLG